MEPVCHIADNPLNLNYFSAHLPARKSTIVIIALVIVRGPA